MLLFAVAFPNALLPFMEKNAWFHAAVIDEPSTRPESSPLSPPPAAQPEITNAPAAVSATAAEMRLILTESSCAGFVRTRQGGA